jgi:hypothetical protein
VARASAVLEPNAAAATALPPIPDPTQPEIDAARLLGKEGGQTVINAVRSMSLSLDRPAP